MILADAPSPATSCAVPNALPHAITVVRPVGAEKYIEENHKSGIVDIKVYLGPDGTVLKAIVFRSSGDTFLDGATYDAAIATTYAPEIKDCAPIAGAYIYRTKYNAENERPVASPTPAPRPAAVAVPTPLASLTPAPAPVLTPPPSSPGPSPVAQPTPEPVVTMVPTMIPTTIATRLPTSVPTTIATTVPTTVPTTVATTIATTVPTTYPTTIATTVPGAVQTTVPGKP